MRTTLITLLVAGLAACAQMGDRPTVNRQERGAPSQEPKVGVRSLLGTVIIKEGIFHCAGPGFKSADDYPSCNGVPVMVLIKPSGGCVSFLPYAELHVHTGRARTRVTWEIVGPGGYKFDPTEGIKLMKRNPASHPHAPGDIYDGNTHMGRKYRWDVKPNVPNQKPFDHDARVVDMNGAPCEPIDPIIINFD